MSIDKILPKDGKEAFLKQSQEHNPKPETKILYCETCLEMRTFQYQNFVIRGKKIEYYICSCGRTK